MLAGILDNSWRCGLPNTQQDCWQFNYCV